MKVAILGPAGTYSEEAGLIYNKDAEFSYTSFVGDIFDMVENGKVDLGIVPVENQLNGAVGETLDYLYKKDLFVIDEIILPIKHILASQTKDFEIVVSHPQALGQCREFLKNLGKKVEETSSTAKAMEMAKDDKKYAAIGNKLSAEKYELSVLEEDIQGGLENSTRFFVISRDQNGHFVEGKKFKTSIAVYPKEDRPGLLFDILKVFKDSQINLTKIESRPSKEKLGQYIFYIDFEGNINEENIKKALEVLKKEYKNLKVFGSYEKRY